LGTAELDIALCDIIHIQKFNTNMQYTASGQMAGEMYELLPKLSNRNSVVAL